MLPILQDTWSMCVYRSGQYQWIKQFAQGWLNLFIYQENQTNLERYFSEQTWQSTSNFLWGQMKTICQKFKLYNYMDMLLVGKVAEKHKKNGESFETLDCRSLLQERFKQFTSFLNKSVWHLKLYKIASSVLFSHSYLFLLKFITTWQNWPFNLLYFF